MAYPNSIIGVHTPVVYLALFVYRNADTVVEHICSLITWELQRAFAARYKLLNLLIVGSAMTVFFFDSHVFITT